MTSAALTAKQLPCPAPVPRQPAPSRHTFAASTEPGAGSPGGRVTDPVQALGYLSAALDFLAHASPAEWPAGVQADCLRALAVAESRQAVAHAQILQAFSVPGGGLNGDGHRSA